MAPPHIPVEIAEAVRRLDVESANWPEDLIAAWKKVRGYVRSKHSESQRVLPAASLVAQEIAQSRNHAQAALDAMSGVFGPNRQDEDSPDTKRHKRPPPDDHGA